MGVHIHTFPQKDVVRERIHQSEPCQYQYWGWLWAYSGFYLTLRNNILRGLTLQGKEFIKIIQLASDQKTNMLWREAGTST